MKAVLSSRFSVLSEPVLVTYVTPLAKVEGRLGLELKLQHRPQSLARSVSTAGAKKPQLRTEN